MVFTAVPMGRPKQQARKLKAHYPFAEMRDTPGTGFVIPAEQSELFQHCRVLASNFNKRHGTHIVCNKQADGSMRVWNEKTNLKPELPTDENTLELLEKSILIVEAAKESKEAPTREQFEEYLAGTLLAGMTISLGPEYAHRFSEFEEWIADMTGFDSEIFSDPASMKITKAKE